MKKLIAAIAAGFITILSYSNPISIPPVYLLKLSFDTDQHWKIIVRCQATNLDSLMISSSSGKSVSKKVTRTFDDHGNYIITVTNDSLASKVNISPEGDSVAITYFLGNFEQHESFIFGSFKNSILPKLSNGQYIGRILVNYSQNNYYSIINADGKEDGKLQGKVYDKNNNLLKSGSFVISPFPKRRSCSAALGSYGDDCIDINSDGTYSTNFFSLKYSITSIGVCT
jgi:hypothetical protein